MSAWSSTSPGGYSRRENKAWTRTTEQFKLLSHKPLQDVFLELCSNGYIPSFWSLCSVGKDIFAPSEFDPQSLKEFYMSTALLTVEEYLSSDKICLSVKEEIRDALQKITKKVREPQLERNYVGVT